MSLNRWCWMPTQVTGDLVTGGGALGGGGVSGGGVLGVSLFLAGCGVFV